MTVNVLGPFLVSQAMLPLIRKGGKKQVRARMKIMHCNGSMSALLTRLSLILYLIPEMSSRCNETQPGTSLGFRNVPQFGLEALC